MSKPRLSRAFSFCIGLLASGTCLLAQFSGTVGGTVTDPSGAAVGKAKVELTNTATSVKQETQTNDSGGYRFVSLAPGSYTVTVEATGFSKTNVPFTLQTSQNVDIPVSLSVSSSSTAIEVTGAPPIIDTADSRNQQTLQTRELAALPLAGRNMMNLVTLAPGVTGRGTAPGGAPGSSADNFSTEVSVDASANGRSANGNMFVIDGLDVTSNIRPGVLNLTPNPDSIQEASVQVNTFGVEYGRASSIQMAMTSKSGSDQFHGLASDYFNYQNFWARTEFSPSSYAPFHANNISAALSGPIIPNKQFFFFGSVEPFYASTSTGNSTFTYESPEFTAFALRNFPNTVGTRLLRDYQATGATFTGVNRRASDLFAGTCGTAATSFLPCNTPVYNNGIFNATNFRNALQWNARIDKYFSKDRIYGNFYRTTLDTGGPAVRPAFATTNTYSTNSFQANETHTFSPSVVNEAAFAFLRVEGLSPASGNFAVPVVSVQGLGTGFGNGFALGDFIQKSYHWRDVLTKIQGSHSFKFGYEGWHGDDVALFAAARGQGNFQFNNILDLVRDQPFSENTLAYNPVTGQPQDANYGYAMTTHGAFFQDTWKIKPNLTFNYGLRWDDFGNPYPSYGQTNLSNFFFDAGSFNQGVANGVMRKVNNVFAGRINNVWSPRFGLAWDPGSNGNWVLRGGFGIYHDFITLGNAENGLNQNPPGYILPTFFNDGTTARPIFAFGTQNTYPFGFPYPAIPARPLDARGGVPGTQATVGGIDPLLGAPNTYNYAATLEHKLPANLVASVGYQGSHSQNLISGYAQTNNTSYGIDVNRFAGDLILNNRTSPTRLNPSFGMINYAKNAADAQYDALVAGVRGRPLNRFYFDASYTRSRSLDNAGRYPTFNDIGQYYSYSSWDTPHRFSLTFNVDLGTFNGNRGLFGRVLSGWTISGTTILQAGNPFTVFTDANFQPLRNAQGTFIGYAPNSGDYNADGFNNDYPNVANYNINRTRQGFLNGAFATGQFTQPAFGSPGNERVSQFRNPTYYQTDAALLKSTKIFERLNLQLRFEAYNVFNQVNLYGVQSNLANANFGRSTQQYNPRNLQVGAKLTF